MPAGRMDEIGRVGSARRRMNAQEECRCEAFSVFLARRRTPPTRPIPPPFLVLSVTTSPDSLILAIACTNFVVFSVFAFANVPFQIHSEPGLLN
jgi:hypothetical protein